MSNVNCMKCIHYFITWDKDLPKGCKKYKMKSQTMPSILVKQETGDDCLSFTPKKNDKKGLDLNSDDLW